MPVCVRVHGDAVIATSILSFQYGDRELQTLWSELQLNLDVFFKDVEVLPSLLHGDLWSGNAAETDSAPGNLHMQHFLCYNERLYKKLTCKWPNSPTNLYF